MKNISQRVVTILEQVFDIDLSVVTAVTPENISQWDSLAHLSIVVSLQDEFDVVFDVDEIEDMLAGLDRIVEIIETKKAGSA